MLRAGRVGSAVTASAYAQGPRSPKIKRPRSPPAPEDHAAARKRQLQSPASRMGMTGVTLRRAVAFREQMVQAGAKRQLAADAPAQRAAAGAARQLAPDAPAHQAAAGAARQQAADAPAHQAMAGRASARKRRRLAAHLVEAARRVASNGPAEQAREWDALYATIQKEAAAVRAPGPAKSWRGSTV
jgi:hypothetical protein